MNAKKLVVGSATAVALTLFAGAMYAQQPAAPQGDTAQISIARQEQVERPDARATRAGGGGGRDAGLGAWSTGRRSRTVSIASLGRRG